MGNTLFNWFHADAYYEYQGRKIFVGPAPFDMDKTNPHDMEKMYQRPWVISHERARKDCAYQLKGIESFAMQWIDRGQPIGLWVEEITTEKEKPCPTNSKS